MTQSESSSNSLCTDQMHSAERELSAFIAAVAELFGSDQARMSVEDWLDESELMEVSPRTQRDWRAITIAASVRLANRVNVALPCQRSPGTTIAYMAVDEKPELRGIRLKRFDGPGGRF